VAKKQKAGENVHPDSF